ncbi:MAG: class IV adenylate cyclase [Planctomycetota bacterium]
MENDDARRANIELKARYPDPGRGRKTCERLGAEFVQSEHQRDTYFSTGAYRMKLRESSLGKHWMIWYSRPNESESRKSSYRLLPVADPDAKRRIFAASMGVKAEVEKARHLYQLGPTRIHLDYVDGLGSFIEFEYVVSETAPEEDGHRVIADLREAFGINDEDLVAGSYSDLVMMGVPAHGD